MEPNDAQGEPRVNTVILSLGSNLGNRVRYLERAVEQLRRELKIERVSSIYETRPVGAADQPWFLNLVLLAYTQMDPHTLLWYVQAIEAALGRQRITFANKFATPGDRARDQVTSNVLPFSGGSFSAS